MNDLLLIYFCQNPKILQLLKNDDLQVSQKYLKNEVLGDNDQHGLLTTGPETPLLWRGKPGLPTPCEHISSMVYSVCQESRKMLSSLTDILQDFPCLDMHLTVSELSLCIPPLFCTCYHRLHCLHQNMLIPSESARKKWRSSDNEPNFG